MKGAPPKSLKSLIPGYGVGGDDEGSGMGETAKPAVDVREGDDMADEVVGYLDEALDQSLSPADRYDAFKQAIAACK